MSEHKTGSTFDKKTYWDRRSKGLHGHIHPLDSKEARYDTRVVMEKMRADALFNMKKGKINERKNRKSAKKGV